MRTLGRRGAVAAAVAGGLLALGYTLQTLGLERTSVSSAGFVTGMYVVLTPLLALACFRIRGGRLDVGRRRARDRRARPAGRRPRPGRSAATCSSSAAQPSTRCRSCCSSARPGATTRSRSRSSSCSRPSPCSPLAALPTLEVPHGWTVWGALLVTGVFASALGFLVQTWAQQRTSATRTALVFTLEPVWAALFGFTLAGDRLGPLGWIGCPVIMCGIVLAEPAAAAALVRLVRAPRSA